MELNLWHTLLVSASGGVIGGIVAQLLSFFIERQRWRRDDRLRQERWDREDAVQRREQLGELYADLFGMLYEGYANLRVVHLINSSIDDGWLDSNEPPEELPAETQAVRDRAVDAIYKLVPSLRKHRTRLVPNASAKSLDELTDLITFIVEEVVPALKPPGALSPEIMDRFNLWIGFVVIMSKFGLFPSAAFGLFRSGSGSWVVAGGTSLGWSG